MTTRDYTMKTRLTDDEKDILENLADKAGISMADYVRMSIFGPRHMRKLPGAEDLVESRRLLKNMANNVNQVTRSFHEKKLAGTLTEKQIEIYINGVSTVEKKIRDQARSISEFMVSLDHS